METSEFVWVNMTPHDINIGDFPPIGATGKHLRVATLIAPLAPIGGVPVAIEAADADDVILVDSDSDGAGSPPDRDDIHLLIVSRPVASAMQDRDDLFVPGRPVRDDEGRVIGASELVAGNPATAARFI